MRALLGSEGRLRELAEKLSVRASGRGVSGLSVGPSADEIARLVDGAALLLFPQGFDGGLEKQRGRVEKVLGEFGDELSRVVGWACSANGCTLNMRSVVDAFLVKLPEIQRLLASDAQAAYDGDPSLYSTEEAVLCYPGIKALLSYRLANALHRLDVPFLPRMITEHAHARTGIDIHPGAGIGESLFIDHGTGVVIGETAVIGNRVRLYQGVTLGARSFPTAPDGRVRKGVARHPILEDDVVVYAWASILGRITVGRGSIIGGNVWVTRDVPPGSLVTQAQVRQASFADGAGI